MGAYPAALLLQQTILERALVVAMLLTCFCCGSSSAESCFSVGSEYNKEEAYYILECSNGELSLTLCEYNSADLYEKQYSCEKDGEELESDNIPNGGLNGLKVAPGAHCTVVWGYVNDDFYYIGGFTEYCIISAPPDIHRGPTSRKEVVQNGITLHCGTNVTGYPHVNVEWRDNNNTLLTNETKRFTFEDGPEVVSLTIEEVQIEDSGNWTCVLNNTEGSLEILIDMQIGDPPSIISGPNTSAVFSPNQVFLECGTNLTGHPQPTVMWSHNGTFNVSRNTSKFTLYNERNAVVLRIDDTDESDGGEWVCSVDNGFGASTTVQVYLSVLDPPSMPSNLGINWTQFTENLTASIQMAWEPPLILGNPEFAFYELQASTEDENGTLYNTVTTLPNNSTSHILEDLSVNTTYNYTLAPIAVYGDLRESGPIAFLQVHITELESSRQSPPPTPDATDTGQSQVALIASLTSVVGFLLVVILFIGFAICLHRELSLRKNISLPFGNEDIIFQQMDLDFTLVSRSVSAASVYENLTWEKESLGKHDIIKNTLDTEDSCGDSDSLEVPVVNDPSNGGSSSENDHLNTSIPDIGAFTTEHDITTIFNGPSLPVSEPTCVEHVNKGSTNDMTTSASSGYISTSELPASSSTLQTCQLETASGDPLSSVPLSSATDIANTGYVTTDQTAVFMCQSTHTSDQENMVEDLEYITTCDMDEGVDLAGPGSSDKHIAIGEALDTSGYIEAEYASSALMQQQSDASPDPDSNHYVKSCPMDSLNEPATFPEDELNESYSECLTLNFDSEPLTESNLTTSPTNPDQLRSSNAYIHASCKDSCKIDSSMATDGYIHTSSCTMQQACSLEQAADHDSTGASVEVGSVDIQVDDTHTMPILNQSPKQQTADTNGTDTFLASSDNLLLPSLSDKHLLKSNASGYVTYM